MRLLNTHSHTSERRGFEADKESRVKRERKGSYPKRRENVNGNQIYPLRARAGADLPKPQQTVVSFVPKGGLHWVAP